MHARESRGSLLPTGGTLWLLLAAAFLIGGSASAKTPAHYDLMVAKDGTGNYRTVQEALNAVPDRQSTPTVIFIRKGIYKEKLHVAPRKQNVTLIGQSRDKTILTNDDQIGTLDAVGQPMGSLDTWTFLIDGQRFRAEHLTVANTAGNVGQAVAMRVTGDQSAFFDCRFVGYQDTLYAAGGRQYFKQCIIEGAVDYIFGPSTAVFDECQLYCTGYGFVTAASTPQGQAYGFVFRNCEITGDVDAESLYLGRPWQPYAQTVFIQCQLDDVIMRGGWDNWGDEENEQTAYFAEYGSYGEGAATGERVDWATHISDQDLGEYTLKKIFGVNAADPNKWYKD